MKITINNHAPERKLVAVLGDNQKGIFFSYLNKSIYLDERGRFVVDGNTLEQLMATPGSNRTPIYEGDSITIQF